MKFLALIPCCIILCVSRSAGQSDLEIYGYVQPAFEAYHTWWSPSPPEGENNYHFNVVGINQANVFFSKNLSEKFTAFVNMEFINNYNSGNGWGSFSLQEAYVRWDARDYFKVKIGLALPAFNNLMEIYNRTPLLPYILRPKLYAVDAGNLVDFFNILPQKALLHVNGIIPVQDLKVDYAAYVLAPVNNSFSSPTNNLLPGYVSFGQPATADVGLGGRLGIHTADLKAGVSFTRDIENQSAFVYNTDGDVADLGSMTRYRFGADFSITVGKFSLAAEYLVTKTITPQTIQDSLDVWHAAAPYDIGNSFRKYFYYATLQYDVSDQLFAYAMYDNLMDETNPYYFGLDGYGGVSIGAGYRVNDLLILKLQFQNNFARFEDNSGTISRYQEFIPAVGVSFSF